MNMKQTDFGDGPGPTDPPILYTIGYESRSIGQYVDLLRNAGVALVIDVRKNALSRKKGFSKKALAQNLLDAGIAYRHLPDLGIESELRRGLKGPDDYARLFSIYEKRVLPENLQALDEVEILLERFERVALTCFELDHLSCHRHCVTNRLKERYKVENL